MLPSFCVSVHAPEKRCKYEMQKKGMDFPACFLFDYEYIQPRYALCLNKLFKEQEKANQGNLVWRGFVEAE